MGDRREGREQKDLTPRRGELQDDEGEEVFDTEKEEPTLSGRRKGRAPSRRYDGVEGKFVR